LAEAPQQQRVVVVQPEERVSFVIRLSNPQALAEYFNVLRSPQFFIEYAEAHGIRLNEWTRELLKNMWNAIAPATTPLMEIYPIALPEAYLNAYAIEVTMLIENARALFEKMHLKCLEEEAKYADPAKRSEIDPRVDEQCELLIEYGTRLPLILALYILDFTHRKAQFSLPVQAMPNSAKAKGGIWTD
jgi:hypothetical protein